jgi:hypothetical protein
MEFLITSDGEWLVAGSKEVEVTVGYDDPDFDLTAFAVKNLGFIQVSWASPTRVRLRLHPDQVAPRAVQSLKSREATFGAAGVELGWLASSWQTESFPDASSALARLETLTRPVVLERYRALPQDLSVLEASNGHPLKLLLQKWRVSFHRFSDSVMPFAMQHGIFSRMMIIGVRKTVPEPTFRFIGDGFASLYGEAFPVNAVGDKIENQPDKEYGAWVRPFYTQVASSGTPRLDVVDAVGPRFTRGPWVRYQRLLLPWETPSGEVFVTLASATLAHGAQANDPNPQAAEAANDADAGSALAATAATPRYEARSLKTSADDIRMSATSRSPQSESGNRML